MDRIVTFLRGKLLERQHSVVFSAIFDLITPRLIFTMEKASRDLGFKLYFQLIYPSAGERDFMTRG